MEIRIVEISDGYLGKFSQNSTFYGEFGRAKGPEEFIL